LIDLQGLDNVEYIQVPSKLTELIDHEKIYSGNAMPDTNKYITAVVEVRFGRQ
jgi:hypothetical protein